MSRILKTHSCTEMSTLFLLWPSQKISQLSCNRNKWTPILPLKADAPLPPSLIIPTLLQWRTVQEPLWVQEEETQWACIFLPTFFTSLPSQHQTPSQTPQKTSTIIPLLHKILLW
ncbi:ORF416 [White spot syndrome virus]|uniref:Wsv381 n=3 Tax=White spot syndrome virus TaxID=342409 RepID=Q8VAM0_WSSVS|nr:wsv381 [Shrimp white spot syndrome virus]AFX59758.1 wsv381 [White spot syndrome virus]AAL33383.1 wsv381 [Shrimp white spot syndrome virus]AAL89308.1 WSSV440 [Shrimp white spot syndrome virus]ATU83583.1 ORF416 [White spot syndrome virus]AWQ60506.1 wsv381 [Shrimp white spot syndrome virus]